MTTSIDEVRRAYDATARRYADRFLRELDHKPLDRALLGWFAEMVKGAGPVADLGCGPGQIARHLRERGLDVFGVDLSPRMVALARELHRDAGLEFRCGNFLALDLADASLAGAVAFYAYVHLALPELDGALAELRRVLRPGAPALLAFHVGDEVAHVTRFLDGDAPLDFHFFPMAAMAAALERGGLAVEMRLERTPYTPQEHPTARGYMLARRRQG